MPAPCLSASSTSAARFWCLAICKPTRRPSCKPLPRLEGLVVAVECLCPWDWLADLEAHAGLPVVLGHARSLQASQGGTAKNDQIDSPKMAALLRGGRLPQASGSPAHRRATRDLRRRRRPLTHKRAALRPRSTRPSASSTCPPSAHRSPTRPTARGAPRAVPTPPGKRVSQSLWRSSPPRRHSCAPSTSPSAQLPGPLTPIPCLCCPPCPASATSSAWCGFPQSLLSTASPGDRILSPLAAGKGGQGIRRHTRGDLRRSDRPGPSHLGLVCSRRLVPPQPSGSPEIPRPPRETTGPGERRAPLGPAVGPGRLL